MLITIDSVLTPAQLQEIQALLQNAEWLSGSLTAGSTAQQVKNNHQLSPNSEASHTIRHIVLEALNHNATFFSAALPLRVFPPRINRHGVGEYYGAHYDNAILRHPQAGSVRSDVSCTVFLNNPEDYEGGELHANVPLEPITRANLALRPIVACGCCLAPCCATPVARA